MRDTARIQTHALFCSLLLTPYSRAHVGTVTSRMGGGHRFGRTHRRMSTRTCTLLLHTSRVDYSSTLYRDLPRSTERYGADTDSESDAEELTRTCQSQTRIQTHAHMSESDAEELTRTCCCCTRQSAHALLVLVVALLLRHEVILVRREREDLAHVVDQVDELRHNLLRG